jgi:hypothetical protein
MAMLSWTRIASAHVEKPLHALVGRTRRARGKNGERAGPMIRRFLPIEDDDPAIRITEGVGHVKKNKVAAIVDHEVERSSRHDNGRWIVLSTVRDDMDICPSHVRPQRAMRCDIL